MFLFILCMKATDPMKHCLIKEAYVIFFYSKFWRITTLIEVFCDFLERAFEMVCHPCVRITDHKNTFGFE